jgi:Tfp pilus assembly protein PilO
MTTPSQESFKGFKRYYKPLEPLITKPQNRVYTATILSFLVISLFLWYAVKPTVQTIITLRREIKDNREISKQMEEKISTLVQAQAAYQSISQQLYILSEAVPRDPNPVNALISVRNLAEISGVTVTSLQVPEVMLEGATATQSGTPATASLPGDPQSVKFTMSVEGTYDNIKLFLSKLISMRRIITIQNLSIEPTTGTAASDNTQLLEPQLKIILDIYTYYLPD